MLDLITSMLVMTLDIYRQSDIQDPDTGAIKKQWNYIETIPCYAKGIISNSATARGGDKAVVGATYKYEQMIEVRTIMRLSLREKITNILNRNGDVIWAELNYPNSTPTVFEVIGSTPITDPFGNILGYNTTVKRSDNQQIDI
jgi:hypothetical protein